MSDSNARSTSGTAGSPPAMQRRRGSSIAGQTFQDLYEAARSRQASDSAQSAASPTLPSGSISSAFQAHRRRLSLTTVGLGNTANSGSPAFSGFGAHRDSNTSTSTTSIDEQAIDDDCGSSVSQPQSGGNVQQLPQNNTPFGRRMSFGARALRDAKTGPATSRPMNGRSSLSSPVQQHILPAATTTAPSPDTGGLKPSYSGRGDSSMGWVDSFVNRGDRRASITFPRDAPLTGGFKARTQSAIDPRQTSTVPAIPTRAVPDAYSERILRGEVDF